MNTIEQIKQEFILAGYTPEESEQLANIAFQYYDPMQPISVTEASEALLRASRHFEYDIKDVEQIIDRLSEIPMINPVPADDLNYLI